MHHKEINLHIKMKINHNMKTNIHKLRTNLFPKQNIISMDAIENINREYRGRIDNT